MMKVVPTSAIPEVSSTRVLSSSCMKDEMMSGTSDPVVNANLWSGMEPIQL